MRDTRGLTVDVRLNGGGTEPLAREVAGRFLIGRLIMPAASSGMGKRIRI